MNCIILLLLLSCCGGWGGCQTSGNTCSCRRDSRSGSDGPGRRAAERMTNGCNCQRERTTNDCGCEREQTMNGRGGEGSRAADDCGCERERAINSRGGERARTTDDCGCERERESRGGDCGCTGNESRDVQGLIPPPWQEYPKFPRRDREDNCEE